MITTDDEKNCWNEKDVDYDDKVVCGNIDDLKQTICSFLDFTISQLKGDRKTYSKETENGELIIRIEDVFMSRIVEEGKKLTYLMKIDIPKREETKVLN